MSLRLFHSQNKTTSFGTIGGTPFYIFMGQSNCGRVLESELSGPQATLYGGAQSYARMWNSYRDEYDGQTAYEDMNAGVNTMLLNSFDTTDMGMEASLAKNLQDYQAKTRYYMKGGVGNTSLWYDWNPTLSGGQGFVYSQFKGYLSTAIDVALAADSNLKLHAVIWMQGENDAINAESVNYGTNLAAFFTAFNTWLTTTKGLNSNYKKVIGRIQDIGAGDEASIRTAQAAYCADSGNNAILIDTDAYPLRDGIHFNATGQIQFGIDIFNAVKDL